MVRLQCAPRARLGAKSKNVESAVLDSIDEVERALAEQHYVADRGLATAIFLCMRLHKPLLLEGEVGVGKTEVAKALGAAMKTRLIRLQGYEGIDVASALYEWNYPRQILAIRAAEATGGSKVEDMFAHEFLIKRPILEAIESKDDVPPVLLIDELDRTDDEFEAFLLEVLSDFQVTIPEIGTIKARQEPIVIMTSNRTREIHDALKRRCLYHWIDYPDFAKECQILAARLPEITLPLRFQAVAFVQALRSRELYKPPGIAETIDWARALSVMGETEVTSNGVTQTLGLLLKNQEDLLEVVPVVRELTESVQTET